MKIPTNYILILTNLTQTSIPCAFHYQLIIHNSLMIMIKKKKISSLHSKEKIGNKSDSLEILHTVRFSMGKQSCFPPWESFFEPLD
jgi:hypothetical protein